MAGKRWKYDELEKMNYDDVLSTFFEEIPSGEESEDISDEEENVMDTAAPTAVDLDFVWDDEIDDHEKKTGGGPPTKIKLNEQRETLMNIVGWTAVVGNENVPECGLTKTPLVLELSAPSTSLFSQAEVRPLKTPIVQELQFSEDNLHAVEQNVQSQEHVQHVGRMFVNPESAPKSDPYQTDEDSDYVPDENNPKQRGGDSSSDNESHEDEQDRDSVRIEFLHVTPSKTRMRKRILEARKDNIAKKLRVEGKEYVGRKGDLSISKMYKMYKKFCNQRHEEPVKESHYRYVFNTEFNLKFHKPYSDTCIRCDSFQNLIKHSRDEEAVKNTKRDLELHQRKAKKANDAKKSDIEASKNSKDTVVVCFDLQQTLPRPLLTTSKVFYL
ncbi:unnamed protein product [Ceutorhynchus assimilis]|uniref:Uncharacterized protein n=1 Tax=Ceutorhynchus assimilis TaxID=467358 RepID=A0A9N9MXD8_9CUCU|nr:unnamed protein product [Ceutorhynchus assimilis]